MRVIKERYLVVCRLLYQFDEVVEVAILIVAA